MKLSLILTINNRTPEISKAVADSFRLPGNEVDEAILVLDRPTPEADKGARNAWTDAPWPVKFVEIQGPPGWICPAKAWNAGYEAATGDAFYVISSETVQDPGNVAEARRLLEQYPNTAIFGACTNSEPINLVVGSPPGILVNSKMPRPLGFIAAYPTHKVKETGGNDEAFMGGLWYEDADFSQRLWEAGTDFLFTDAIHGTHINHERQDLESDEGKAKISINARLMIEKHGTLIPWWTTVPKISSYEPGLTHWMHL